VPPQQWAAFYVCREESCAFWLIACEEFRRQKQLEDFLAGTEFEIGDRNREKAHLESIAQYAKVPLAVPHKQTVKRVKP
jgi:hypothetical protein